VQQTPVTPTTLSRARQGRRSGVLLVATLALSVTSIAAGAFSLALFTDQETVDGTFSSGTIILDDVKIDGLTLTTSNMMPGDSVTDDVVVENDGSAQLRYAVSASTTNPDTRNLRSQLTLTVRTVDATTPATPCNDFDGTQLFTGTLGATTAIFGDPAAGVQGGERNLNGAANETLCFRVSLPISTGNAYQGATAVTTFTFDAEQTTNNP
jgi:predicted ribosomally synthesized peptide with SipW-like signal peptide